MAKIYTKTGDRGETSLFGGERVGKDNLRLDAYGTVDELNSVIGVCRSVNPFSEVDPILRDLQEELFVLGADLATPQGSSAGARLRRIQPANVSRLEQLIDTIDPKLEPLKQFILPSGSQAAAMLHFARTVCRRAERKSVELSRREPIGDQPVIYLNRLSDLLFVVARWVNTLGGGGETKWDSGVV